jgi:hypothetical protein
MLCEKCQRLDTSGSDAQSHSDLTHVNTRFYRPLRAALEDARTDVYECTNCTTRWERDFDPTEGVGFGSFRQTD